MAFGCLCVALANLMMVAAATGGDAGTKASPAWLVGYFALVTVGELFVAPVGLALISKVAPLRLRGMMMGVWFATTLPGDTLGGFLGGGWSTMTKPAFYLTVAAIAALAGAIIWAMNFRLARLLAV